MTAVTPGGCGPNVLRDERRLSAYSGHSFSSTTLSRTLKREALPMAWVWSKSTGKLELVADVEPSVQLNYYSSHPPTLLNAFNVAPISLEGIEFDGHGEPVNTLFSIGCSCGSDQFEVHANIRVDDEYVVSPVELTCISCKTKRPLFDQWTQGYDGALGHYGNYRGEPSKPAVLRCDQCKSQTHRLAVRFEYPSDLLGGEDFKEWAGREQDLFSWFSLIATGSNHTCRLVDIECS